MDPEAQVDPALADPAAEPAVEPEPFTLPDDFATRVQEWDVPLDQLETAAKQYKSLQTEEGIIDAFIATGQSLGFGLKDLNKLFDEEPAPAAPAAPAAPVEPVDPEALMSRAEVEAMLADVRRETADYALQQEQARFQEKQNITFAAIDQWFGQAGVDDPETRRMIAQFGERHILPNQDSYDPRVALAALEQGRADYDAFVQKEAQRYLAAKGAQANGQPTSIGRTPASAPGNEEPPADYASLGQKALATAKERVRARLREAGEIG